VSGERLGSYELGEELGRGGMGRVHRARHGPTGAVRAVKVLTLALDPETVERFRREAEALARVAGDGVVPVHETGVEGGRLWFAMDVLEGGSLRSRLAREVRLPWRDATAIAARLARVLARCHERGIVHRDVKPANVLLDGEGRPWLADFGLVRDLGASPLTQTGSVVGTLAYMTPEQLEGKAAAAGADVYALAALLHELVLGAPPFGVAGSVLAQHEARRKARQPLAAAGAPRALDAVVGDALAFDPRARTTSAAAFAERLEAVLSGRSVGGVASRRRLVLGLVLGGALTVALGFGLAFLLQREVVRGEVRSGIEALERAVTTLHRVEEDAFVSSMTAADAATIESTLAGAERAADLARRGRRLLLADARELEERSGAVADLAERSERARVAERELEAGRLDAALATLRPADNDPLTCFVRARIAFARGEPGLAGDEIACIHDPDRRPAVWELLGDAYRAEGRSDDAIFAYARAVAAEKTPVRKLKLASAGLRSGTGADAIALLETIDPETLPDRSPALASLAPLLYTRGLEAGSPKVLEVAWRLGPPGEALRDRVIAFWRSAASPGAVLDGVNIPALDRTAVVARLRKSVALLARVAEIDRDADVEPAWQIAQWLRLWAANEEKKLLEKTREVFADWPDHPRSLYARAKRERGEAALALVLEAIDHLPPKREPEWGDVRDTANDLSFYAGKLLAELGRRPTKEEIARIAAAADRSTSVGTAGTWLQLERLFLERGELDAAEACFARADTPDRSSRNDEGLREGRIELVDALAKAEKWDRVVALVTTKSPRESCIAKVRALAKLDRADAAVKFANDVAALDPGFPRALHDALGAPW